MTKLDKIISGGQTGVDRAALDVALRLGMPLGGWCPRGRLAEDGPLAPRYPLAETPEPAYAQRTEWNVRDSDGTLILTHGEPMGGTALTRVFALQQGKPHLVIDLAKEPRTHTVIAWLHDHNIRVLNVAGPRASTVAGIYEQAALFLETLFTEAR